MKKLTLSVAALALAALFQVGCTKDIQNNDAVKQSVIDYLRSRTTQTGLNMDLMQVDVTAVSFDKNEARATVYFRPKNTPAANGMAMTYVLDRKGNKWVVRGRQDDGANPHGVRDTDPDASPAGQMGGQMPAGHPPVGAAPGNTPGGAMPPLPPLPPGHPSTGSTQ